MYTLMILDGNEFSEMKYPDRLSDAFHLAHDSEWGNNFVIMGDGMHLIGSVQGSRITWKRGG